jgi:hypothetical protein
MKYYVSYDDDYDNNGGVGLSEFDGVPQALAFIEERMSVKGSRGEKTLSNYTLIQGRVLTVEPIKVITKLVVKEEI